MTQWEDRQATIDYDDDSWDVEDEPDFDEDELGIDPEEEEDA